MAAEKADSTDNDYTVSTDTNSAFGSSLAAGGYLSNHDVMEADVTQFNSAGIIIVPTTTITGTAFVLAIGDDI
jgi:hypothetical protein